MYSPRRFFTQGQARFSRQSIPIFRAGQCSLPIVFENLYRMGVSWGEAAVLWKQPGQCWQLVSQLDIATSGHLCGGGAMGFLSVGVWWWSVNRSWKGSR